VISEMGAKVSKFRIAVSRTMLAADGSLAYPACDFTPLDTSLDVEYAFFPAHGGVGATYEVQAKDLADFDAVILWAEKFTQNSAGAGGRLALVQRFGAGLEKIDIQACTQADIALARVPDAVRRPVGVMILTLILAATGKLLIKDRIVRAGPKRWGERTANMGVGLVGRTLGILGLGTTGAEAFRLAKPLDMKFIAHDPFVNSEAARSLGVRMVGLEDLFRESDVLAIACPLTKDTYHLVNSRRLALMKPSAFLINSARGGIVDQNALVEALAAGQIAGAGLDVLEREPPDSDEPIFAFENVVLTPHALCWTDQCFADCFSQAVEGVFNVMRGRPPKGLVNSDVLNRPEWSRKLASFRERFGD
jgi:phosphoglycerate dehydrogenase-like enzyme